MTMMKCGCAAQATNTGTGEPVCVTHMGLTPDAKIVADTPELTGRQARCSYDSGAGCPITPHRRDVRDSLVDSATTLAFFKHQPHKEYDSYFDGCWGWD